ncbi:hypothetical protein P2H44_16945 [Albimonas sp. CAU 1670]|uniref:hypothetical protein n=1 Tax=Albimonas sp. CAU 1670 TaxID=3032599 RepID=UPI0023DA7D0D|nr:hypothetical protein [Albimonas sp. CAU 1670]MDF2234252.1 hypothetical protein [Albimonas sp. CAU 1670]
MPLISLDDPLWSRLYGPYGVQDVPGDLRALQEQWTPEVAERLLWERLHHQGDLYPATWAAIPWLWEMREAGGETLAHFFATVLQGAREPDAPGSDLRGLTLDEADHQFAWLPEDDRLREADEPRLAALAETFAELERDLDALCLAWAGRTEDPYLRALLLAGCAASRGSYTAAEALELHGDGLSAEEVAEEVPQPDARERAVALELARAVETQAPELAAFLRDLRAEDSC